MGRAYLELEQPADAIMAFDRLTVRFPQSALTRRATTEKAMVYNSIGERDKAIETYKDIIERYPHSEEAQVAFQDLKNIYVEMGEVNEFAKYATLTKGTNAINSNEIDTLSYSAAEKIYGKGDIEGAKEKFTEYLENHEKGAYRLDSHFYLGEICHKEKEMDKALEHFEEVIEFSDNKYTELAIMRAAGIYYNKAEYEKAGGLYKQLLAKSSNEERRQLARINIMRTAQKREKHSETIKFAAELLANSTTSPEVKREATYNRAKAYIAMDKENLATNDLEELSTDTRTKEGAEAKYLLAQIYFDNKKYDDCEKEVLNYIEVSTPHAYWLARSFVLLSDLYITLDRKMEAKQYLLSLQNNYSGDDDIAGRIKVRLEKLADEENNTVTQQQ
jgi:TolA-binding protein